MCSFFIYTRWGCLVQPLFIVRLWLLKFENLRKWRSSRRQMHPISYEFVFIFLDVLLSSGQKLLMTLGSLEYFVTRRFLTSIPPYSANPLPFVIYPRNPKSSLPGPHWTSSRFYTLPGEVLFERSLMRYILAKAQEAQIRLRRLGKLQNLYVNLKALLCCRLISGFTNSQL